MKKIALLVVLFSALLCKAEDQIQVKPFAVQPNTNGYVDIELINDGLKVSNIQFDLYMPDGVAVYTNSSGNLISSSIATVPARTSYSYYDEEEEDDVNVTALGTVAKNFKVDGNGVKFLAVACGGQGAVQGTSGAVLSLRYKVADSATPGVYPIIMKNIILASPSEESVKITEAVSYVVVGNPTDAALTLEGNISSFVNEALASESAIGTLDLTKVTASNGTFTYVDGRKVVAPEAGVKGKVAYKREVSGLASICLPFNAKVDAYTYTGMAGDFAKFDAVTSLDANTPAIVEGNIDIVAENATIGGVEGKTITSGYYLKGGKFCKVNGSAKIAPLRGCWDITAPVKGFKFNDADAILTVDANANEDIFNLNGVKLNKAQRGVNIIGGKKVMK